MSWRTQGHYRALSAADREWLDEFDHAWDTKAEGRNRQDAYEKWLRMCVTDYVFEDIGTSSINLAEAVEWVERFTVPKRMRSRWGIHLRLVDGRRIRVSFRDETTATEAHAILTELCHSASLQTTSEKKGQG